MSGAPQGSAHLESYLGQRRSLVIIVLLLAVLYTWEYVQHPLNPGWAPVTERTGWWSWSDQYKYYLATESLAAVKVTRETYHYPLGYSLLGVPFLRWLPGHPFFVPDLLLVLASAACWWRLARRWLPATVTLVSGALFIVMHGELLRLTMIVPWNTLATQLALLAGMVVLLTIPGRGAVWRLAGLAAAAWLVRPIDAVCFAPMLVWAVWRLPAWRDRQVSAVGGIAIIGAAIALVGGLNLAVFGTWRSPYETASLNGIGFFAYPLSQKLYWTLVDARPFFGETDTALLWRYPWLFLVIPAAAFWIKRERMNGAVVLSVIAMNGLLYLGYNDFFPSSLYRFSLIHYLSWSFLPLLAGVVAVAWAGWRIRVVWLGWVGTIVLLVAATGLQLEERELPTTVTPGAVPVLPAVRPLWVRFPGESLDKVIGLRLDGRAMLEGADYQIPYVPGDLALLLGDRAKGTRLQGTPESGLTAPPRVGDYQWGWRWDWGRWRR